MKKHRKIRALLDAAFDGVPLPSGRTLLQAEAADCGTWSPPRDHGHTGRWQDLPRAEVEACPCAFSFLDAEGVRYYLPALLTLDLCCRALDEPTPQAVDSASYGIQPGGDEDDDLRDFMRERFALLTAPQRAAVAAWARHADLEPATCAAWRRAAAPGDDWFIRLWPPRTRPTAEAVAEALQAFPPDDPLGCMLRAALTTGDRDLCRSLDDLLQPDLRPDRRDAHRAAIADLTPEHRRAIATWLDRCSTKAVARRLWARLALQEADGPKKDWLDLLYVPLDR
jgi:hypothetical protein